jgi:Uma2 family endonuclease
MEAFKLDDRSYTREEFLRMLEKSDRKMELTQGGITMMSGASRVHNDITDNTFVALRNGKSGCYIKSSDTAVSVQETGDYFFPDISATCEEPDFEEGNIAKLINPNLIVEVLSLSTERRDRGIKFEAYMRLKSLKEYILIDSKTIQVHVYYRAEKGSWIIGNYYNLDQNVEIKTLGVSVPMSTIYEGIKVKDLL